jgi:hypothetical protein
VQQAAIADCLSFDPFAFNQNGLATSEIDVGGRQVADALVISQEIVVGDGPFPRDTEQPFQRGACMEPVVYALTQLHRVILFSNTNAAHVAHIKANYQVFGLVHAAYLSHEIELGRHGRSRSNVWNYRGVNTFGGAGRMEDLGSHPTVKPVALVADAMRDCTRRRDIVLDTFSGSGATITRSEALRRAPATPFRCGPLRLSTR